MALQVPNEVESWMRKHEHLLDALRTQFQSMSLILSFTPIAAGFGIAAILITAVMSRLQESIRSRIGTPWKVEIRPELVLAAIGLAVVLGLLAALHPAWRASRVVPIDVIRGA